MCIRDSASPVYTPVVLYDKICFKFKPEVEKKPKRRSSVMSHGDHNTLSLIIEEDDPKTAVEDNSVIVAKNNSAADAVQDEHCSMQQASSISRHVLNIRFYIDCSILILAAIVDAYKYL